MSENRKLIFVDGENHQTLLPLTFTRPAGDLRLGILTIAEKWALHLKLPYCFNAEAYLQTKFPLELADDNLVFFDCILPDENSIEAVKSLQKGTGLYLSDKLTVARVSKMQCHSLLQGESGFIERVELTSAVKLVTRPYHMVAYNKQEISSDFELLTRGRTSQPLSPTVTVVGAHMNASLTSKIFLEPGAIVEHVMINPSGGPVYIGRNAVIQEGSIIRGPFAMCEHAQVNMGAKIYGGTTLGPWCKAGGELNNAIMLGYSNKGHDGFLGDSVIGEWCNLGADTNTSNLKNDFSEVKLWDYQSSRFLKTGLQFLGLIMGDYSRCGINSMFNTGTVVGVACSIYGSGYPRNFVPSFSLGGAQGFKLNGIKDACKTALKAMERRNISFSNDDEMILTEIFELTRTFRTF
jgi:UDP-N-acetylglucosamine diphosphorylase/glucosamine-1-phosphate N-acetyltransferase